MQPEIFEYPKIQTIWKRDPDKKFCIIPGEYSMEEFESINCWSVTEKIHGTNIRVIYDPVNGIEFRGKTDKADLYPPLVSHLQKAFPKERLDTVFNNTPALLFGEGFGAKIEKGGGNYISDGVSFALCDIYINGWWLKDDNVHDLAKTLEIPSVPRLGILTTEMAIDWVEKEIYSLIAENKKFVMEGIVAQSHPLMFNRKGERIIWKLKVEDYRKLRNEPSK